MTKTTASWAFCKRPSLDGRLCPKPNRSIVLQKEGLNRWQWNSCMKIIHIHRHTPTTHTQTPPQHTHRQTLQPTYTYIDIYRHAPTGMHTDPLRHTHIIKNKIFLSYCHLTHEIGDIDIFESLFPYFLYLLVYHQQQLVCVNIAAKEGIVWEQLALCGF